MQPAIADLARRRADLAHLAPTLDQACEHIVAAHRAGGGVLACGNGGSCADADHLVGELAKGFLRQRPLSAAERAALVATDPAWTDLAPRLQGGLRALNLGAHAALVSAIANDLGADLVYAQQVLVFGRPGDVFIGFSTSGRSRNVCRAAEIARCRGLTVIAFTGEEPSPLAERADLTVAVPAGDTAGVQELHLPCYHALCAAVEAACFAA